jgi:eukaryotic-like serine/threonine-protein kinase
MISASSFTRGSRFAGYTITERLGTTVFQVEDGSRRSCALRVLPRASVESVARCFSEACSSSEIDHGGIARTLDVGVCEGRAFIVTELVDREPLSRVLARVRNCPLSVEEALRIARRIAAVLVFVHDQGLAHGGLDPDSILVDDDGVSLIGFGLAALGGGDPMACIEALPAPVYISPEQCRTTSAYDARSDLYLLGCILYELLSGHPPFRSKRMGELVTSHLMAPPPPLPASVPTAVRDLVSALLSKSPDDRPTALVAVHTLAGLLDELETTAIPRAPWRWLAVAALAVSTFLVIPTSYENLAKKTHEVFHVFDGPSLPR